MKHLVAAISTTLVLLAACARPGGSAGTVDADSGDGNGDGNGAGPDAGAGGPDASCTADLSSDPNNCGACGAICSPSIAGTTASCRAGLCVEEQTLYNSMTNNLDMELAADANYLYVSRIGPLPNDYRDILRINKTTAGSSPISTSSEYVIDPQIDGSYVYFGDHHGVERASVSSGVTPMFVDTTTLYAMQLDASTYYFAQQTPSSLIAVDRSTNAVRQVTSLTNDTVRAMVIDPSALFFTTCDTATDAMCRVSTVPKAGGSRLDLATSEDTPYSLAVDDTYVYWANYSSQGSIRRTPKAGGPIETLAPGGGNPDAIRVVGQWLVWGGLSGGLRRMPLAGGSVQVLHDGYVMRFVADGDNTYYLLELATPSYTSRVTRVSVIPTHS